VQFEYVRPTEWSDAVRLMGQPGAVAKMGGCDVLTRQRGGRLQADLVVGLNDLPGAGELLFDSRGVQIGAAVTLARLERDAEFRRRWPVLAAITGTIASPEIRSLGTVVGNVAQGWSVGDLVPLLQAHDATLEIIGPSGKRRLSVSDFAKTPGNGALKAGEIIVSLHIPAGKAEFRVVYERFSFRRRFDLPLTAVAIGAVANGKTFSDTRIAVVGGTAMPARCAPAEAALDGKPIVGATIDAVAAAVGGWVRPPADHLASAEYRRHVLIVTLRRAMAKLAAA
jgi:aerobic carbon-monoxide dehydrogenase medium subunit